MTLGPGGGLAAGALECTSKPRRFWLRQFCVPSITGCVCINMGMPANLRSRPPRRNQRRAGSPIARAGVGVVTGAGQYRVPGADRHTAVVEVVGRSPSIYVRRRCCALAARGVGQPEDVANAIVYLASTPYSTMLVDGGASIV